MCSAALIIAKDAQDMPDNVVPSIEGMLLTDVEKPFRKHVGMHAHAGTCAQCHGISRARGLAFSLSCCVSMQRPSVLDN